MTAPATAPTPAQIDRLVDLRTRRPLVPGEVLAARLGISHAALSKAESGKRLLPKRVTWTDYFERLLELKREAGATEEQLAPWIAEIAA